MINIFNVVEEVYTKCTSLKNQDKISDYRIILNYNNLVDVYIILGSVSKDDIIDVFSSYNDVNLSCFTQMKQIQMTTWTHLYLNLKKR